MARLIADKGYDSNALRSLLVSRGIEPVIPGRRTRKVEIAYDRAAYHRRHVIENRRAHLKDFCRIALRRDKYDETFMGFVFFGATLLNLKLVT